MNEFLLIKRKIEKVILTHFISQQERKRYRVVQENNKKRVKAEPTSIFIFSIACKINSYTIINQF
jgi:hypothetical protein